MLRRDYSLDFSSFEGRVWLNSASEGPLPRIAISALQECMRWKSRPYLLTHQRFREVPAALKRNLGQLINVAPEDIILGNSTSYGIHLLANGLPLSRGDEVLLMENDFPADILPWLGLTAKGVVVRQLSARSHVLEPDELLAALNSRTRVVCLPHVHTFSGYVLDIPLIGAICRKKGISFILNGAQSVGGMPLDLQALPVDAITAPGFKWLCGPYGTGFCWIQPSLRDQLEYNHAYWINVMTDQDLAGNGPLTLTAKKTARTYDVFGTANFFNFYPWTASVGYLLKIGMDRVEEHNRNLVDMFLAQLERSSYETISPRSGPRKSALVVFSHRDPARNRDLFRHLSKNNIFLAFWKGMLRVSPHIFNVPGDIRRLVDTLKTFSD